MASSGTITLNAWSVDNGTVSGSYSTCGQAASGTCYETWPAAFGRGACQANITFNWSVNNSGVLSVSYASTSYVGGTWYVCSQNGYHIDVDFSTDQSNWTTIMSSFQNLPAWQNCSNLNAVGSIASTLAAGLTPVTLTQSGYVRIRMWTLRACPTCGGTIGPQGGDKWPNAFPSDAASSATAVPVHIDVNWTSTLKYNANGGTGAPSNQTHTNAASASSYAETVSSTVPTRENYRFEGWADSASATTAQYQPGGTVTIQKSSPTKTIYAVWTEFYRPGAVFYSTDDTDPWTQVGEYDSHNRTAGNARILPTDGGTVWTEMRTIGAPTELGDTPSIFHDDKWYNQKKLGKE